MPRYWVNLQRNLLRAILPLLRRLSPRASSAVLTWIGWLEFQFVPGVKEHFLRAAERGRIDLGGHWDDREVALRLACGRVEWRTRDRLLDRLSDAEALSRFQVQGREYLDEAHGRNRGVILLANHFGSHLHSSHWLFREDYPLRLFSERPRNISRFMTERFRTEGTLGQEKLFISRKSTASEAAGSILRAMRILDAGMILKIASDVRWHGGHTSPGHFLGSTYLFSTTWVVLAARTGAPVVPVFCRPDGEGQYILEFQPSFRVPADAVRSGQAAQHVQRGLDGVTEQVLRHPDQSNDYFFWARPEIGLTRVA
ncbi:lysophospholipid acyltransferase family protein [Tundrisphaera lichenicola]|uniref:lysophospholipid acyltransferase family protein n=1 Tax=Tundrisphaera lichenicola TaxID=2029860 RepID=UPI003EBA8E9C